MGSIVSIVSGKGGAGKSTFAAGVGRQLCLRGRRVLLVDTDCGLSTVEFLLEHTAAAVYHGADVLSGAVSLSQAVVTAPNVPDFLAAPPEPFDPSGWKAFADLLTRAASEYDTVLLDRPAGLDTALEQHLPYFRAVVICPPDPMAVRGAAAVRACLEQTRGMKECHTVINRFLPAAVARRQLPDLDELRDQIGAALLGVVPNDPQTLADQISGTLTLTAPYAKALRRIAARMDGEPVPLPNLKKLTRA